MSDFVRVKTPFATSTGSYPAGLKVPADAPVVDKFPQFFDLTDRAKRVAPPVVEQATAAPGEVRTTPAKKKAAARKAAAKKKA